MELENTNVTDAFNKLLKTLCLHEFPCGNGPWRKQTTIHTIPLNYGKRVMKLVEKTEPQFAVTLRDYGASRSHIESLQEFVSAKHSPWTFDYSWSEEAKSLRELAVKCPELIDEDFIYKHFVTLRLTDKGISEVDEKLLKFSNLEYVTLSANYIKNVNSRNLPRKLLSLELNSNQVSELFSLCVDPPPLVHLGLGSNCLAYVDDYLSGDHWPALLSLDLSYNNLTDLPETLRKLKTLPNLRNLILMGNPLMLTPGYRGFVIDNLKAIDLLDDCRIEADERHRFNQMSKLTEHELSQCLISFQVGHIKNPPVPLELQNPDEQPEYPIISRHYYVEFQYIEEKSINFGVFEMNTSDMIGYNQFDQDRDGLSVSEYMGEGSPAPPSSAFSEKPADFPQDTFFTAVNGGSTKGLPEQTVTSVLKSEKGVWASLIELNWTAETRRDDLLAVRDFLQKPMKINVVEETVLSYPKEDGESEKSSSAKKKKDNEPKKDDKKNKKKKDDADLRHEPAELNILGTFEVNLDSFLMGDISFTTTLSKSGVESRIPSGVSDPPNSEGGTRREKTHLKSADKKGTKDPKTSQEARRKSAKKEGKKKEQPEPVPDPDEPAAPLEINITIEMKRWNSTAESIQSEGQT